MVCGYAGSAELTLHYIFTSSTLFFLKSWTRKIGPGISEKYIIKLVNDGSTHKGKLTRLCLQEMICPYNQHNGISENYN